LCGIFNIDCATQEQDPNSTHACQQDAVVFPQQSEWRKDRRGIQNVTRLSAPSAARTHTCKTTPEQCSDGLIIPVE